ncbi:MAG TPA: DUF2235 domain-containing protein [Burkholderiales bacterium]|nr:DUF2235 domain-containing protein [Burkholderiales bacterium]
MRRLVVCCDGTWNTPDQKDRGVMRPTNVVKIARFVLPQGPDGIEQQVHYDKGVGTGDPVDRLFGGAFGIGLAHNVREAYEYLSLNYQAGDDIYLFGFSRGAYTVRRVVGMMRKAGLLPAIADDAARKAAIDEAYAVYEGREARDQGGADSQAALDFRQRRGAQRVPVRFLGVWDTVGAYGIAGVLGTLTTSASKARFHDLVLSSDVRYACHAVAIDEHRRLFQPTLFQQGPNGAANGQLIEQSWFAGAHSNVGGGYEDSGLSDIALCWMATKAKSCGLALDDRWQNWIAPDEFGELRDSRAGVYQFLGKAFRPIGGLQNGFERLHHAPLERMERDPAVYRPENAAAYVKSAQREIDFSAP